MPQKPVPSMRSWGTRFDTLPSSPPLSPTVDEVSNVPHHHLPQFSTPDHQPKEEKMPHDASVFVGSLPSTVDHQELTRLLSEHLSEHTEVKNIKVVRDSKGGVCAFVQCEDAASAAALIHTLHSNPPKPFMGRHLRYEPARAFRTLLVSYRTPMQYISGSTRDIQPHVGYPLNKMNQPVELSLPFAMKIWKPRHSKFYQIVYNAEAASAESHAESEHSTESPEVPGLFLQPVTFNSETIQTLAAFFGRLESIRPYQLPDGIDVIMKSDAGSAVQPWAAYPPPHDSHRSPGMDSGCWEIKWEHRDDCVSALMTLRRVPHLTVTWAHQPPAHFLDHRFQFQTGHPPQNSSYPLHVQNRAYVTRRRSAQLQAPTELSSPSRGTSERIPTPACFNDDEAERKDGCTDDINSGDESPCPAPQTEWSEVDFPPLPTNGYPSRDFGVWSEKSAKHEPIQSSSPNVVYEKLNILEGRAQEPESQELEAPSTPVLGRSPLTPKTPGPLYPDIPTGDRGYAGHPNRHERELDPTTLFVGGLETLGPGAWDEEKVAKFFSRFGGLESVKVVRPQNSHAAFAFVKFNNTHSPARAVLEEHNRVYEGRAMRVQLRDINPPRGHWRHRGRGRFQSGFVQNRVADNSDGVRETPQTPEVCDQGSPSTTCDSAKSTRPVKEAFTGSEPPAYSEQNTASASRDEGEEDHLPVTRPSSPHPSLTPSNGPPAENFREWYDDPPPVLTPPPSTLGPSTSVLPYPMSTGYYGPPQWLHSYGPLPYQIPFMGYPNYRPPGQQLPPTFSRPGPEVAPPAASGPWPTVGVYGTYIPYQTQAVRTPSIEAAQPQTLNSRAPLAPTGFIQNDQGTLIAVYQPEALDQYMAGSNIPAPTMTQSSMSTLPNWPQFPQSPACHYPSQAISPRPPLPQAQNVTWLQHQSIVPQQPSNPPAVVPAPTLSGCVMGYRGGYHESSTPLQLKRQPTRRESSYHGQGRNGHARTFASRNLRGNANHTGYHIQNDTHSSLRVAHLNQSTVEWNQWASSGSR